MTTFLHQDPRRTRIENELFTIEYDTSQVQSVEFVSGRVRTYIGWGEPPPDSTDPPPGSYAANATHIVIRYWRGLTPKERVAEEKKAPDYKAKIQQAHREVCRQHFAPGRYETRDAKPRDIPARRVPVRRLVTPVPKTGKLLTGR